MISAHHEGTSYSCKIFSKQNHNYFFLQRYRVPYVMGIDGNYIMKEIGKR